MRIDAQWVWYARGPTTIHLPQSPLVIAMVSSTSTTIDIAARGRELYDRQIRALVEPQHRGQFLVLDIASGDYAVGPDDLSASKEILARRPQGVFYGLRIGQRAAYRLGGFSERRDG